MAQSHRTGVCALLFSAIVLTRVGNLTAPLQAQGAVVNVSTEAELQTAVQQLASNTTIVLAPGTYRLTSTLWINGTLTNVAIRGGTSNRDDVVLLGGGMANASYGAVPHGIWVGGNVQGITIANLTIRDVYFHPIIFNAGTQSPHVYNVRLIDAGEQFIKSNPDGAGGGVNNGVVESSIIEYTATSRDYYTNGVDVHTGANWIIRDNLFRNIVASAGQLAGPAILMWNGSSDTLTERNTFLNCARGIAYGLGDKAGGFDHSGGIIRNNVFHRSSSQPGDVGILVADSPNTQVLNNTVFVSGTYPTPLEYRFAGSTGVVLKNNLLDGIIQARDGASGTAQNNLAGADASMFVNAATGDLHLSASATSAIDRGVSVASVTEDWERQPRPQGAAYDIGADEYQTAVAPVPDPHMALDQPGNNTTVTTPFAVAGWAIDRGDPTGTGVDTIHVWAHPVSGGNGIFLGVAAYGHLRPDVAAAFGSRFTTAGFGLIVQSLASGTYRITAFAHSTVSGTFNIARQATVTVNPSQPAPDPHMSLDEPHNTATVLQPFAVTGWVLDRGAPTGTGIDTIHVWAHPVAGGNAVFLGVASYGHLRPDVGAIFGSRFSATGFGLIVRGVAPGNYRIVAYARSTVTGTFNIARQASVTMAGQPHMAIDVPAPNATIAPGGLTVAGWALDLGASSGTGVDTLHVWAYPLGGGSPIFVGVPAYGASRPDVGAAFGARYTNSGYHLTATGLTAGTYDVVVHMHSTLANAFTYARAVRITVASGGGGGGVLLQSTNLEYQGAFRVPAGTFGSSSFAYGGTGLAFNSARNSLFVVGHDWDQAVAEISIPAVVNSASLSSLSTATVLQPFEEATEGKMNNVGSGTVKVGGLLPYQGQLYLTAYLFYDATASQSESHFISGTDLSATGDARGPYKVGTVGAGFVSGYFANVPANWQAALGGPVLNGQCCLSIITRTSFGPAVFAIDPTRIGVANPAPATPLVYYPSSNPLAPGDTTSEWFNLSTEIRGVVFPEGTSSVLFFGRHGVGPYCYGTGGASGGDCYDPDNSSKGTHAYPYRYYVWAYDANDLAAVKAGQKQPWDVRPYAVWPYTLPLKGGTQIQGATYDSATGRIFVTQAYGDGELPVVHVFKVQMP